jgi:hypothetical protein
VSGRHDVRPLPRRDARHATRAVRDARHATRRTAARRRRRAVTALAAAAAVVVGVSTLHDGQAYATPPPAPVCPADAVQARAVGGLVQFTRWLQAGGVQGFVGEVGWPAGPDAAAWASTAEAWYRAADDAHLPVTAWAAGRWPAGYRLAVYRASAGSAGLDTAGPQAEIVERHAGGPGLPRGIALATAAFGTPRYGSTPAAPGTATPGTTTPVGPGRYGTDYSYDGSTSWAYLAAHGVRVVRLAVTWERLQSRPFGPLDPVQVGYLLQSVRWAEQSGLRVVLDLHGYGDVVLPASGTVAARRVLLGSAALPVSAFADLWRRLAAVVAPHPAVVAYGLLNEPVHLAARGRAGARLWERASQAAVLAVRAGGAGGTVLVSSYGSPSPVGWPHLHGAPWIHDPAGDVAYEAHAYFDADGSGRYATSYAEEVAAADRADAASWHSTAISRAGECVLPAAVPDPTLQRWTS